MLIYGLVVVVDAAVPTAPVEDSLARINERKRIQRPYKVFREAGQADRHNAIIKARSTKILRTVKSKILYFFDTKSIHTHK